MGPVLKEAVFGWLCEPPLDRLVMAFASAVPEHGGTGATYVLLRRKRSSRG
jgi:DNA-nicking Smr family endonuclease